MRTATRMAAVTGGILAALAMSAGPAQAGGKDDPDVRAACATFNRIGVQTGLWTRANCANWRANQNGSVLVITNGNVRRTANWPFDVRNLPSVININGTDGPRIIPLRPPRH